ncbi:MAG: hypothetical protein JKY02_11015 [Flavobacteriaceae bacterium]|nr:hypothetical protein [Flavobacteriaceae bacterium]
MEILKKLPPYIYFVVAILWLIDAFQRFFEDPELYYLIFSLTTTSKYGFIAFKVIFAILIVVAGVRRLQMQKKA